MRVNQSIEDQYAGDKETMAAPAIPCNARLSKNKEYTASTGV